MLSVDATKATPKKVWMNDVEEKDGVLFVITE